MCFFVGLNLQFFFKEKEKEKEKKIKFKDFSDFFKKQNTGSGNTSEHVTRWDHWIGQFGGGEMTMVIIIHYRL